MRRRIATHAAADMAPELMLEGAASARAAPLADELADVDGMVSHWEGSEAMRQRLRALAGATASVLIVLDHVPWNRVNRGFPAFRRHRAFVASRHPD